MRKKISEVRIFSEVGRLRIVLLKRPNNELYNLLPNDEIVDKHSIDDTVYLKKLQEEHDYFSKLLKSQGVNVFFLEKLLVETIKGSDSKKHKLIDLFVKNTTSEINLQKRLYNSLSLLSSDDLIMKMISGIIDEKFSPQAEKLLFEKNSLVFSAEPLPNIIFQRDPFFIVGKGNIFKSNMFLKSRRRETLFLQFVLENHVIFKGLKINLFSEILGSDDFIEGGDLLVLNKKILIISLTERTTIRSIRKLRDKFFQSGFRTIICLDLKDKNRRFMHLDTVFTNVYYDRKTVKFLVYPLLFEDKKKFRIIEIKKKSLKSEENLIRSNLQTYLAKILEKQVIFIHCGIRKDYKELKISDHIPLLREQ